MFAWICQRNKSQVCVRPGTIYQCKMKIDKNRARAKNCQSPILCAALLSVSLRGKGRRAVWRCLRRPTNATTAKKKCHANSRNRISSLFHFYGRFFSCSCGCVALAGYWHRNGKTQHTAPHGERTHAYIKVNCDIFNIHEHTHTSTFQIIRKAQPIQCSAVFFAHT